MRDLFCRRAVGVVLVLVACLGEWAIGPAWGGDGGGGASMGNWEKD